MTLIVGIKCSNGIVVGADSAATLGNVAGLRTVIQPVAKLNVIRNKIIVAVSGPLGTSQLYCDAVDRTWNNLRDEQHTEVCRKLRLEFMKDAKITLEMSALCVQVMGPAAREGAMHQTLVALVTRRSLLLIQFDYQCAPEMATDDLPFVSIGSGQSIADPFLAFLRNIFWKDRLPTLSDGSFAVMWTMTHAIRTAPGGISRPIQIATLEIKDGQPAARLLSEPEIRDHELMIETAEKHLQDFRQNQQPTSDEPEPPSSPAEPAA